MARKHKPRSLLRPRTTRQLRLRDFHLHLQQLETRLDSLLDQQLDVQDDLLAQQRRKNTWTHTQAAERQLTLINLQQHTQQLRNTVSHRRYWIERLRQQQHIPSANLSRAIQTTNQDLLHQRGQITQYPRTSFHAHWSNPPLGHWEPRRTSRRSSHLPPVRHNRPPVDLRTRPRPSTRRSPIDLTTGTDTQSAVDLSK